VRAARGPVLELGLGTGRLAIPLAREAVAYHGIEAEPSMIAALRAKMLAAGVPNHLINVHHGSFIDFDLGQQFALVLIPANAIAHVVDHGEAVSFFRAVRRHTAADGTFMIDTYNPRPLGPVPGRHQFSQYADPLDGLDVVVYSTPEYDHSGQITIHRLEY
jgi:SAM-dependent methyltransferase